MDLEINWHPGLPLEDGAAAGLIYTIPTIEDWQGTPGVYMFCRTYGESLIPLYIGRSKDIGKRAQQHLESTRMMRAIQTSPKGQKTFVIGALITRRGQQILRALKVVEKTLIDHALTQGYELVRHLRCGVFRGRAGTGVGARRADAQAFPGEHRRNRVAGAPI